MFRKAPGISEKGKFAHHITMITEDLNVYKSALDRHKLFVQSKNYAGPNERGFVQIAHMEYATVPHFEKVINCHTQRIDTLSKMQNGEAISRSEFDLLMKMPVLEADPMISGYEKITSGPQP